MRSILIPLIWLLFFTATSIAQTKNVLFIAIDDLKPQLGCYGDEHVFSPNIDRLAKNGTTFLNAHCQQAICGASRVSLLTGYFPDTTGIYGMGPERYRLRKKYPDMLTLPQHFKNNGYTTIGTGKIFDPRNLDGKFQAVQDEISWTKFFPKNPFNKEVGGPKIGGTYHNPALGKLFKQLEKKGKSEGLKGKELRHYIRKHGGGPAAECYDVPDDAYKDGAIANRAIEQLDKLKGSGKPFFLAMGFVKPHLPFVAPKKYWDLYDRDSLKLASNQDYPENAPACAGINFCEGRGYSGVPEEGIIPDDVQRELIQGYLACTTYVDAQIGRVMKKLTEVGLADNTIVVLWGDHGFHLGDKQIWGKHTNFEQATRVPLIIANTGTPTAKTRAPANLVDLFPTLCELTGLDTPTNLDGKSLVPVLKDPRSTTQQFAASIYPHNKYFGVAIRTKRFRYVAWYKGRLSKEWHGSRFDDAPEFSELYDYKQDPHETENLIGKSDYADVEQRLAKLNREHAMFTQDKQFKTDAR